MTKFFVLAAAMAFVTHASAETLYFGATGSNAKKTEFCDYSATVPQVVPVPGDAQAQAAADALNAKWKAQLASIEADFQNSTLGQDMCKSYENSYQTSQDFEVASALNAKVISIVFENYSYTGGAHGYESLSSETFNAQTGEGYKNLEVFLDDAKLVAFKAKVKEYLGYQVENFDPTFGYNDWDQKTTSLYEVKNFAFTPAGLEIYFNPYEVASYSEGIIKITLDWEALKEIGALKTTGPATLLEIPVGSN